MAACVSKPTAPPSSFPEALKPPVSAILVTKLNGVGVQIYPCAATKDDPAKFAWALQGPQADLFDDNGNPVGRHYAGPTWEAADGSRVVGEVLARDPGPDPASVPWLLLKAKENAGTGVFGTVQYVQRLDTKGGKAAAEGCDQTHAGDEQRVQYKATYAFFGAGS